MALHRNIYWVGRQWAVTGTGVQAIDQRLKGAFDIEVNCLWEDDLLQRMRALAWVNIEDFKKALEVARTRFPAPERKSLPLVESVLELIPPASAEQAKTVAPRPIEVSLRPNEIALEESPKPTVPLALRMERASARFLPQWRVKR